MRQNEATRSSQYRNRKMKAHTSNYNETMSILSTISDHLSRAIASQSGCSRQVVALCRYLSRGTSDHPGVRPLKTGFILQHIPPKYLVFVDP